MHFFTVTIDVSWLATEKGTRVRNKHVYCLRESVPLPSDFLTTRQRAKNLEAERKCATALVSTMMLESEYQPEIWRQILPQRDPGKLGSTFIRGLVKEQRTPSRHA